MKIFVINLEHDHERLASIDAQLRGLGLTYERFPAVWAGGLSAAERRRYWRPFRWWCAVGHPIRNGELGCAATHNLIYRKMVRENIPVACILEDDAQLTDGLPRALHHLESAVRSDENKVFLLTNYTEYRQLDFGVCPSRQDSSTEAYVLTCAGAKSILRVNDPCCTPCDRWQRFSRLGGLGVWQVFPTVCRHADAVFGSYSAPPGTERGLVKNMSFVRRLAHKVKRAVGISLDLVLGWLGL